MDENTTVVAGTETPTANDAEWENAFSDNQTSDGEGEIFGENDDTGAETEGEEQSLEDSAQTAETEPEKVETQETKPDGDTSQPVAEPELFELKALGETRKVTKDEIIPLAQKGLDYDGVKADRDALREVNKEYGDFYDKASRLYEFAEAQAKKAGITVDAFVMQAEVAAYMQDGYTEAQAKKQVELDRREAAQSRKDNKARIDETKAQQKANADAEAKEKRSKDNLAFLKAYPDVKPTDVPKEVWTEVQNGKSLVDAYEAYKTKETINKQKAENEELKKKLAALETNKTNKSRSAGSLSSAGANTTSDPFLSALRG